MAIVVVMVGGDDDDDGHDVGIRSSSSKGVFRSELTFFSFYMHAKHSKYYSSFEPVGHLIIDPLHHVTHILDDIHPHTHTHTTHIT